MPFFISFLIHTPIKFNNFIFIIRNHVNHDQKRVNGFKKIFNQSPFNLQICLSQWSIDYCTHKLFHHSSTNLPIEQIRYPFPTNRMTIRPDKCNTRPEGSRWNSHKSWCAAGRRWTSAVIAGYGCRTRVAHHG